MSYRVKRGGLLRTHLDHSPAPIDMVAQGCDCAVAGVAEELCNEGLAAGLEQITAHLDRRIVLPHETRNWPDLEMIRRANAYRQING